MFIRNVKKNFPAVIIFLFFASLYIYTAAPGVYDGDSGEIAAAVNQLGLAHPTGFPLYMLSGKLFTLLVPIRDVAYRLNIFSSILTASALVFFYYTLKNLGNSSFASLAASFVLGLGRNTIWSNAGTARVYALSSFFVSLLLFVFSKWKNRQETKYLYWYGFLWGLSFGTHTLMLAMAPPFLFMLWQARQVIKNKIDILIKMTLLTIIPAVQYLYLPLAYRKDTIVKWGDISSFNGFWYYVSQKQFAGKFFNTDLSDFFAKFLSLITSEFTIIFFLLAVLGLIHIKKYKNIFIPLIIAAVANVAMMYAYGRPQDLNILYRYLFIADFILVIFVAYGLELLIGRTVIQKNKSRFVFWGILIGLAIMFQFKSALADNLRRGNFIIEDTARNILNTLEPNAVVFSYGDVMTNSLWYLQSIGERQDVIVVDSNGLVFDWYIKNMQKRQPDVFKSNLLDTKSDGTRFVMIVEENFNARPIYSVIFSFSNSATLKTKLEFIPDSLLFRVAPKNKLDKKDVIGSSRKLWSNYNLKNVKTSPRKDFMLEDLVKYYALALYLNGITYYNYGFPDALVYIQESLEIYPDQNVQIIFDQIKKGSKNNNLSY